MTGPGQRPRSLPAFSEAQRLASRPRGVLLRPPRSKAEASKNSPLPPACPPGMLAALLWKRRARVPSKKPTQDIPKNSRAFCCPTPSRRTPGGFSEAVVIRKMFGFSALRGDVKSTARCGLWMRTPAGSEAPPGGLFLAQNVSQGGSPHPIHPHRASRACQYHLLNPHSPKSQSSSSSLGWDPAGAGHMPTALSHPLPPSSRGLFPNWSPSGELPLVPQPTGLVRPSPESRAALPRGPPGSPGL